MTCPILPTPQFRAANALRFSDPTPSLSMSASMSPKFAVFSQRPLRRAKASFDARLLDLKCALVALRLSALLACSSEVAAPHELRHRRGHRKGDDGDGSTAGFSAP